MNRRIISLGVGHTYPDLLARLEKSLGAVGETATRRLCRDYPDGCPTLSEIPFGFKPWLFWEAYQQGCDQVLWLDSQVFTQRPLDPVWEKVGSDGHFFIGDAWNCGQFCSDAALEPLGITREEAWTIPQIWAKAVGLDFTHEKSIEFLAEWLRLSRDGVTFHGRAKRRNRPYDPAARVVYGHRHDQTAASVLVHRMELETTKPQGWIDLEPVDNKAILGVRRTL